MNKDNDLLRIKSKINSIKKILNEGPISYLIHIFISWMVTLEITNGNEKITIQEILIEFKNRINTIDKLYDETEFVITNILNNLESLENSQEEIRQEKVNKQIEAVKKEFKQKLYQIFDINDIFSIIIKKCVKLGSSINRFLPYLNSIFKLLTIQIIDSIFLTNTDEDFEKILLDYINERFNTIEDESIRKFKKISILQSLLKQITSQKIDNYDIDSMIELR
jgi:hypothetical protein